MSAHLEEALDLAERGWGATSPNPAVGAVVVRDGEVVGIVTALYNPTGQHVFAGMGFAVPIENAAKAVGENPL